MKTRVPTIYPYKFKSICVNILVPIKVKTISPTIVKNMDLAKWDAKASLTMRPAFFVAVTVVDGILLVLLEKKNNTSVFLTLIVRKTEVLSISGKSPIMREKNP